MCTAFGSSMYFALLFFFVDGYLGLGAFFPTALIVGFGASILSLGLWYEIAARWGKSQCWCTAMLFVAAGMFGFVVLQPGEGVWLPLLICMVLVKCGFAAFAFITASILSDISDYGTWKYGNNYSTSYFAIFSLINKGISAIGAAAALAIIGWFQFDPKSTIQSDAAVLGLKFAFALTPLCLIVLSIQFISGFP